jgi:FkbM family methyltransferase
LTVPSNTRVLPLGDVNRLVGGRHGYFLANQFDVYVGLALIRYGEYSELEWEVLDQLIQPGATVVEVGANIGCHTIPIARKVGPGGRVIAVEPQRIVHQYLSANVSLNMLDNVECHWAGCGAKANVMVVPPLDYFSPQPQNFGGLSLTEGGNGERVKVVPLDEIMRGRPAQLVKIDVEGMEAEVLHGATNLISTHRPVIYAENDRPAKSDELLTLLWSLNYRTYWHVPRLYNPDNAFGEQENIYANTGSFNLVCLPRETEAVLEGFEEVTAPGVHPLSGRT